MSGFHPKPAVRVRPIPGITYAPIADVSASVGLRSRGSVRVHFHLPKPLHRWREFSGEVGIIVVGVLIALSFEQVVSSVHDRASAAETRDSIRAETEHNLSLILRRQETEGCMERRMRGIAAYLNPMSPKGRSLFKAIGAGATRLKFETL